MRDAPAHYRNRLSKLFAPRPAAVFVRGRTVARFEAGAAHMQQAAVPRAETLPLLRPPAARMARAAPHAAALATVKMFGKCRKSPAAAGLVLRGEKPLVTLFFVIISKKAALMK